MRDEKLCSLCGKRGYKFTFLPSLESKELDFDLVHERCLKKYFNQLGHSFEDDTIEKREQFLKSTNEVNQN